MLTGRVGRSGRSYSINIGQKLRLALSETLRSSLPNEKVVVIMPLRGKNFYIPKIRVQALYYTAFSSRCIDWQEDCCTAAFDVQSVGVAREI